ncbi:hypothetical protein BVG19_g844 [[Candida] boidinii]|nr:hypothetical protein BVG19_g844 [[Candida] boidinii]OWB48759.1 hypothetical protein B5S27_g294 [[Candida] boidinii]
MSPQIPLGRYFFERMNQLDVNTIFGVPGDFNLALLDHIYEVEGMRWAGNANELNAAYAADGYSRIKGLSCLITTFGVGELSALNGVAGAFAEHVGMVHLVGVPSISATEKRLLLHHTLGNGDFHAFREMSKQISKDTLYIDNINYACEEIDRIITEAYVYKRPVYIALPTNFVEMKVDANRLKTPLETAPPLNEPAAEDEVVDAIKDIIKAAKKPIILVDACALRHDSTKAVHELSNITQFPVFTTPMGKSSVDESHPRFGGVYVGVLSQPDVKEVVESSDLILSIGGLLSDFNTGSFSYDYHTSNVIEFHSDYTKIRKAVYQDVKMPYVVERLVKELTTGGGIQGYVPTAIPKSVTDYKQAALTTSGKITQEWWWKRVSTFFRPGDIIISETGTSAFGITQSHFPTQAIGISQVLWGSIGFTVGACLGAVMGAEEKYPDRRVILFVGDGSLQLTVQEISTMCRWKLNPYLFVLNNAGYTIEKLIHGPTAQYNEIQLWDHSKMLPLFHGEHVYENYRLDSVEVANKYLEDPEFNTPNKIRMVELMLDVMDAPSNLVQQAAFSAKTNAEN